MITFKDIKRQYNSFRYRWALFTQRSGKRVNQIIDTITIVIAIWCIGNSLWQIGFSASADVVSWLIQANRIAILYFGIIQIYKLFNYWNSGNKIPKSEIGYAIINWLYFYYLPKYGVTTNSWLDYLGHQYALCAFVSIISFNEISRLGITILSKRTSPTLLFIGSFIVIILIGCGLLLMPRSNTGDLSFVNALFTSTSAVCVNGLTSIDVPSTLTTFGQIILLILIQVGGLGVMTFTCFFALSLTGKASFQNRFVIKDLVSVENMTDIFKTLKRIMYVTFVIEIISTWLIYAQLKTAMPDVLDENILFYAAFHAISSFCNAGFSNLDGGLMNTAIIDCRSIQIIVILTVILGSSGFPVQSSLIDWVKLHLRQLFYRFFRKDKQIHNHARLISANNRIIIYTHLALVFIGAIIFFITEYSHTQATDSIGGRCVDSFFLSISTRSVGFNTVDLNALSPITILIMLIFMWIGGAPLSTAGGIKVTTFAIAIMNLRATLKRKETLEAFGRQISRDSILRAFAMIILSIIFIVICAIALKVFDPQISMTQHLFESCSAISTTGLSLNVTGELSVASRLILIVAMFIGRIGILAFVLCFIEPSPRQYYSYPYENIVIQ